MPIVRLRFRGERGRADAAIGDGPYRTPPARAADRRRLFTLVVALAASCSAIALALILLGGDDEDTPTDRVPRGLLDRVDAFPAPPPDLPPAAPLAPLLSADQPEGLALLEPGEGATRLRRRESLRIRFNRPMVEGAAVGDPVETWPVRFDPQVRGVARWVSRSAIHIDPDPATWDRSWEARLALAEGVRSQSGEELFPDELERVVIFDASPRILAYQSGGRVNSGEPLPLLFDGPVATAGLLREMLVYEVGGGARSLPFSVASRGFIEQDGEIGPFRVDLLPLRALEPGSQIGVAIAPRWTSYGGMHPTVLSYELTPRPRIEAVGCPPAADSAGHCSYGAVPGAVVDIESTLRLLSSAPLADLAAQNVSVRPALPGLEVTVDAEGGRRLLALTGAWEPDQVYEVRVTGLATTEGDRLLELRPLAVRSAGHPPTVHVRTGRYTWEPAAAAELGFAAIHVDAGELRYRPVAPGEELVAALSPSTYAQVDTAEALPLAPLAPEARPNRWGNGRFVWRDATRDAPMAVVGLRAGPTTGLDTFETSFFQTTDLGVTMRSTRRDFLVWVTSLSRGTPVRGARVRAVNAQGDTLAELTTDGNGVAWTGLDTIVPVEEQIAVLVTHGADRAVAVLDPRTAVGPVALGMTPGGAERTDEQRVASLFTDRGAYKPGESVHVRVTARRMEGVDATPLTGQVTLRLLAPSREAPLAEAVRPLSPFGTAEHDFVLPDSAALGSYRIEARHESVVLGRATVRVAEFREPQLRVDADAAEDDPSDGEAQTFTVSAQYLFGAPVTGGQLRWSLVRQGGAPYPQRYERYVFRSVDASPGGGTIESGEATLDARGVAEVQATASVSGGGRETLLFEAEVSEPSGQTMSARTNVTLHPADLEVGLRDGEEWVAMGETIELDAIVIDKAGEQVFGRPVDAQILREGWHGYWEWADGGEGPTEDGYRLRRDRTREPIHRCPLVTAEAGARCSFVPTRPGTYVLIATTTDARGRQSVASRRLYVAGPDEHPDRDPPGAPITLTPARRTVTVGERAEIAFESPFPQAEALITVERDGVLYRERRRVGSGGQVLRVPISDRMVPNAFVALTLVRPRTGPPPVGEGVDLEGPDLRFGAVELTVRPARSELTVRLAVAERAAPGTGVPVRVRVTDARGRPVEGEVALWAVDEGRLRLTSYRTPDPTSGLYVESDPAFAVEDLRRSLVSRLEPPAYERGGGDGDDETASDTSGRLRYEQPPVDPTPLWIPQLRTDRNGRATATLPLPDRTTEYRVMAVAIDRAVGWGRSERRIVATRPLVLRDAMPRFVTEGDRFEAAVFVHNASDAPIEARVETAVGGEVQGTERISLPPGGDARVARTIEARGAGPIRVAFRASARGVTPPETVLEAEVPVAPRGRWVRAHAVTAFERDDSIALRFPGSGEAGRADLRVTVASHPMVGFEPALELLGGYPFDDAESLSDALTAYAAYAALDLDAPGAAIERTELEARARGLLERFAMLSVPEGGMSQTIGAGWPDAWATARAIDTLRLLEGSGLPSRPDLIERSRTWLLEQVPSMTFPDDTGMGRLDRTAFALRVLADAGHRLDDRIDDLYANRQHMGAFGLAELALAMEPSDRRRVTLAHQAVQQVLEDPEDREANDRPYDRGPITLGAVLEAACGVDATRRNRPAVAGALLDLRQDGGRLPWGSSHETAAALRALARYAALFRHGREHLPSVSLGDDRMAPVHSRGDTAFYRFEGREALNGTLAFGGIGRPAFVSLEARYTVPLGEPDAVPRGRAVALHRILETAGGTPLADGDTVRLGELVRVRLFLWLERSATLVTLRDPLGGGFDAVDRALDTNPRTSLMGLLGTGPDDEAVDPRGYYAMRSIDMISGRSFERDAVLHHIDDLPPGLHEITYAVRASTAGTFLIAPAQIEALYDETFLGRSGMQTVVVRP